MKENKTEELVTGGAEKLSEKILKEKKQQMEQLVKSINKAAFVNDLENPTVQISWNEWSKKTNEIEQLEKETEYVMLESPVKDALEIKESIAPAVSLSDEELLKILVERINKKKERIEELIPTLNEASAAYYGPYDEIMPNFIWDALRDELEGLENQTLYILDDSPTQNTGADDDIKGEKENHEFPALSLAKTKKIVDLRKWAGKRPIWLSWKLDGLTLVLTYDNGNLTKIVTRGNGITGTNITRLKDALFGFPKKIKYKGHMVVRGEATISYDDFDEINELIDDEDEKYSNPRNLASGTLALDDLEEVKRRKVWFNAFTLVHLDEDIASWGERMNYLEELGFNVVAREYIENLEALEEAVERWTKLVEDGEMNIPVDGLVIAYDDTHYAATGSVTGHHATRAGYAFKWKDEEIESTLQYVEWSCGAASITPVGVFDEVQLEGTKVSRASLCNITEMKRLGIQGKGTKIVVIKANKIIPKIVRVESASGTLEIPDKCPICGAPTRIKISEKGRKNEAGELIKTETLHCTNPDCIAKKAKNFERFVSKDGMAMDGIAIKTVMKFINMKYIKTYADMYHLSEHFDAIKELPGFGETMCKNMGKAIEKSRKVAPTNVIYSLCIPIIGKDAANNIVMAIGFDGFVERLKSGADFTDIKNIGTERSNSIKTWYLNDTNKNTIEMLLPEIQMESAPVVAGEKCKDLTICVTGELEQISRKSITAYIASQGGKVTGSVSKKTNYLITNETESDNSKFINAKKLNIPILTEQDFIDRFIDDLEAAKKLK